MSKAPNDKPTRKPNPDFHGKPGRSGPPKGNLNSGRHFLRAGSLPKRLKYIEVRLNCFRRNVESLVVAQKGEVSLLDAARINTALRHERHAILAQHWLRVEGERMAASDRLRFSEAIGKASDSRDKALVALGLDKQTDVPWLTVGTTIEKGTSDEQD